jgi:hypothetical protein
MFSIILLAVLLSTPALANPAANLLAERQAFVPLSPTRHIDRPSTNLNLIAQLSPNMPLQAQP